MNFFSIAALFICLSTAQIIAQEWTTTAAYGVYKKDGFAFNNNRWSGKDQGTMSVQTGTNLFSYWTTHDADGATSGWLCTAPYVGIGTIDQTSIGWSSDQYGLAGSHLPMKLNEIEQLKSSWRFQIPLPISSSNNYRIYYEIFLSNSTSGVRNSGNICAVVYDNQFCHQDWNGGTYGTRQNVNGYAMDVKWNSNPFGQGDMADCVFPVGTYAPDDSGNITVAGLDLNKIIQWCAAAYPGSFNVNNYITELNLAFEVMTLHGTLKTTYASFYVKKTGSAHYITPAWTVSQWEPTVAATGVSLRPSSSNVFIGCTQQQPAIAIGRMENRIQLFIAHERLGVLNIYDVRGRLVYGRKYARGGVYSVNRIAKKGVSYD